VLSALTRRQRTRSSTSCGAFPAMVRRATRNSPTKLRDRRENIAVRIREAILPVLTALRPRLILSALFRSFSSVRQRPLSIEGLYERITNGCDRQWEEARCVVQGVCDRLDGSHDCRGGREAVGLAGDDAPRLNG
jgi:hypothetical protein